VFEPTALEVHRQAAGWYWDQEIFDFIACRLQLIAQHSLHMYMQAWESGAKTPRPQPIVFVLMDSSM
jgi:hypothetical protein